MFSTRNFIVNIKSGEIANTSTVIQTQILSFDLRNSLFRQYNYSPSFTAVEIEQETLSPLAKATQIVRNGSRIPRSQTDFKAGTPNLQAILSLSTGSFPAKGLDFVLSLA